MHSFYMDACPASVASEAVAQCCDWLSVQAAVPEEQREKQVKELDLDYDILPVERTLCVQRCVQTDAFQIQDSDSRWSAGISGAKGQTNLTVTVQERLDDIISALIAMQWTKWIQELHLLGDFKMFEAYGLLLTYIILRVKLVMEQLPTCCCTTPMHSCAASLLWGRPGWLP